MKKISFVINYIIVFLLLCSCAKRESDMQSNLYFEDVAVLYEKNHSQIQDSIGPENHRLEIDAELFVPDKIITSQVQASFPDIAMIQKVMRDDNALYEQKEKQQWAIVQDGADYNETYYGYDDMYASFYDIHPVRSFDDSNAFLKSLDYQAVLFGKKTDEEQVAYFYSPAIEGVPIVSKDAGFGGSQVYMKDNSVRSFLLEPQYSLLQRQEQQQVISEKCVIEILENAYSNGEVSPLQGEKIKYIRLAYYVDEHKNLVPAWCFSIDFDNREYVMYCIHALDGTVLFDYNGYAVAGEGET